MKFSHKKQTEGKYLKVTFNNWINLLVKKLNRTLKDVKYEVRPYKSYDGSNSCRLSVDTINRKEPWNRKELLRVYIYLDRTETELNIRFLDRINEKEADFYYDFNNKGLSLIYKNTIHFMPSKKGGITMAYTTENIEAKRRGKLVVRDLSPKAYEFYRNIDQLAILDYDDGTYSLKGFIDEDFDNFEDLNATLEELADQLINKE